MPALRSSEFGEVAFRIIESGGQNSWLAVVVDGTEGEADIGESLRGKIRVLGDEAAAVVSVASAAEFEGAVRATKEGVLLIAGGDGFSDEDWRRLDLGRSRLARNGTTVLILGERAFGRLEGMAPNLASWIGGAAWRLSEPTPLDSVSVSQRLVALRAWSGMNDAEVVEQAEDGVLPNDPSYAEWLALLGRGDLLAR